MHCFIGPSQSCESVSSLASFYEDETDILRFWPLSCEGWREVIGPAGVPERGRFVMGPEGGLYPFRGETEAPQAMGVSPGGMSAQGAKSTEVPRLGAQIPCPLLSNSPP